MTPDHRVPHAGGEAGGSARAWVLAIEASNPSAAPPHAVEAEPEGPGVALGVWRAGVAELVGMEPLTPTGRHDDDLLPAIARVCARCGVRPRELAVVAVSCGPGGFTGLRVSVTAAKVLAEVTGASLRLVPSWQVGAVGFLSPGVRTLVCLASKRDRVYAVLLSEGRLGGAQVLGSIAASEAIALAPAALIADQLQAPELLAWAARAGARVVRPVFSAARVLALAGEAPGADPAAAAPIYAREPEAVRLWEARARAENPRPDSA